ncbi:hypothetical protein [Providencia sp. PROV255]|uniref:hypothetical protein n=1 Tax=Providencia sp. PROV255 TaxID=2949943 RepID=UPI00234BB883|nr:hypothetical protein [Providencia sp. PROV255]
MKKMHLLYLFFLASYSYSSHASEAMCPKESAQINAFNNFILYDESIANDPLKEMRAQTISKNGYLTGDMKVTFDNCGALLTLEGREIKKSENNGRVLISDSRVNLMKAVKDWDYEYVFKMTIIDENGEGSVLMQQKMKGKYEADETGKINKATDISDVEFADENVTGKSETSFVVNRDGKLSELKRRSTLNEDNSTKKFFYDQNGRLVKAETDSGSDEFFYDETGKELSIKSIKALFTAELSTTTCKEWNEHGRCTKAELNAASVFKGENGNENKVVKNQADILFSYTY